MLPTRVRSSPFQRTRRDSTIHRIWKKGHIVTWLHLLENVWSRLHGFALLSAITKNEKLLPLDSPKSSFQLSLATIGYFAFVYSDRMLMMIYFVIVKTHVKGWESWNYQFVFFSHLHVRTAEECENQWYLIDLLKQTLLLPYQKSSDVSP